MEAKTWTQATREWFVIHCKWLGTVTLGWFGNSVLAWSFDHALYPFVIYKWGALRGGLFMGAFSILICYLMFCFYDWSKTDWLGIELAKKKIKSFRHSTSTEMKSSFFRFWVPIIFLSTITDPFITVLSMRENAEQYAGLSRRDWKIFLTSAVISNFVWTISISAIIQTLRFAVSFT